jgi:hypothetical protein
MVDSPDQTFSSFVIRDELRQPLYYSFALMQKNPKNQGYIRISRTILAKSRKNNELAPQKHAGLKHIIFLVAISQNLKNARIFVKAGGDT